MSLFAPASPAWTSRSLAVLRIVAGLIFIITGAMKAFGFLTRPVAFILSGEMAIAYWQVHNPVSPYVTASGGMPAAIFCFLYLYMAFAGGGAWSVDSVISRANRGALR